LASFYAPKHPEILRINPKAQVPVLVDGDLELFDSTQIFEYLEDSVERPRLWPEDPKPRARARLLELKSDEIFFPNVVQLFPHNRARDGEEVAKAAMAALDSLYAEFDRELEGKEYLAGPLSYADLAFFPAQYWAAFIGAPPSKDYRRLHAWRSRVAARESVRTVVGRVAGYLREHGVPAPELGAQE
jgi:glutathione S-transferase